MRIIDADKVISLWDKYHYSIATHAIEFDEELRKLSTVEAVPISFIEEMKAWAEENGFVGYVNDLIHLLLSWEDRKDE